MSEQVNVQIARDGWDAWNAHDVNAWLKIIDEQHVWETDTLPAPLIGRDAAGQAMRMYLAAFPDLRFTVDQLLSSRDYVVSRYTATGTHQGDLIAPGVIGTPVICSGNSVSCRLDRHGHGH
jgi:predicted ester cyclase